MSAMPATVTVLSTSWCGVCKRLVRFLHGAGVRVLEVDLEAAPDGDEIGDRIQEMTGGYRIVPTVVIEGLPWLVNPTGPQVLDALAGVAAAA